MSECNKKDREVKVIRCETPFGVVDCATFGHSIGLHASITL